MCKRARNGRSWPGQQTQPLWGRGPTCGGTHIAPSAARLVEGCRRGRKDSKGSRPSTGGRRRDAPSLRLTGVCFVRKISTARGGVGAPPAGGGDEMSPGDKHSRSRPGQKASTSARSDSHPSARRSRAIRSRVSRLGQNARPLGAGARHAEVLTLRRAQRGSLKGAVEDERTRKAADRRPKGDEQRHRALGRPASVSSGKSVQPAAE